MATLTLPSVTITGVDSTSITATAVGGPWAGSLPAGTVVYNCTVAPANWNGAVSLSGGVDGQFVVAGLAGYKFSVTVGSTDLPPGTYNPGTLTTVP